MLRLGSISGARKSSFTTHRRGVTRVARLPQGCKIQVVAFNLKTHHALQPPPPGPLMVRYSGSHMTCSDLGDVRELIHEGRISDMGCLMLGKNRSETLIDDGTLDSDKSD